MLFQRHRASIEGDPAGDNHDIVHARLVQ